MKETDIFVEWLEDFLSVFVSLRYFGLIAKTKSFIWSEHDEQAFVQRVVHRCPSLDTFFLKSYILPSVTATWTHQFGKWSVLRREVEDYPWEQWRAEREERYKKIYERVAGAVLFAVDSIALLRLLISSFSGTIASTHEISSTCVGFSIIVSIIYSELN